MNKKYLSLGSNIGDRKFSLALAIQELNQISKVKACSPVYETPSLTNEFNQGWSEPFLNIVVEIETSKRVDDFLVLIKNIENKMGRLKSKQWAPRLIDIDILIWGHLSYKSNFLQVPHKEMLNRSFVLDPLSFLNGTYLDQARLLPNHQSLLMGIVNVAPDSFSNTADEVSIENFENILLTQYKNGVHIVDIGAESTRPNATSVSLEQEWSRLEGFLKVWHQKYSSSIGFKNTYLSLDNNKNYFRPLLSIDTYKPEIARRALPYGLDIFNDVSGHLEEETLRLLKESELGYVLTHSLDVPVNPSRILKGDVMETLCNWLEHKIKILEKNKINLDRVFFDPGIGFGKSPEHSFLLLKNIKRFMDYPVKLLVGHSRKSFMNPLVSVPPQSRDIETLGVSMELQRKGVDVLRVHNVEMHKRGMRVANYVRS